MDETASNRELADAIKELFKSRRGEFQLDDLVEVLKEFELTAIKKLPVHLRGRMYAKKHFVDIFEQNLGFVLEEYEWEEWRPMTSNGITVTGFWDLRKGDELPEGYEMDLSGRFLKMKNSCEGVKSALDSCGNAGIKRRT